jgi:uncharacterized protein YndB with AHSA1/START domain
MEQSNLNNRFIEKELFIRASPERVFRALTEKAELESWFLKTAEIDLHPGGTLLFDWGSNVLNTGKIRILQPPHLLSYTWEALEPVPTTITFELTGQNHGTHLHLLHSNIGTGKDWDYYYNSRSNGWNVHLQNLIAWLETGLARPHRPAQSC